MMGTSGNDTLNGTIGNDTMDGLGGDDSLFGNAGNDTIFGGDGNDTIFGGTGRDVLYGGAGNDQIDDTGGYNSTSDPQLYFGDGGNDSLNGTAGNDTMFGGTEDDRLIGEGGDDSMSGDAGNDSMLGEAGNDTLFGGDGADTLLGGTENDFLNGGAGNDNIDAGSGDDIVVKDDFATVDSLLAGGTGIDTLRLLPSDNRNLSVNIASGLITDQFFNFQGFSGFENITTGGGNDTITGNSVANLLEGGAGNDVLNGAAGADILFGGDGADTFILDQITDADTIVGSEGGLDVDHINLSTNPAAAGVTVSLTGNEAGTIAVNGGAQIATFTQIEQFNLTAGNDVLSTTNGITSPIIADGGAGADSLHGGGGNDSLSGGSGNDTLAGGSGGDTLDGGDGNDLIDGGTVVPTTTQFIRWSDIPDPQDGGQIDNLDVVPGTFSRTVAGTTLTVTSPASLVTDFSTADIVIDGMPAGTNDFSSLRSVAENAQAGTYNFNFSSAVSNLNFTISELGAGLDYIDIVAFGPSGRIPIDIIQGSQVLVTTASGFEQRISELVQNFSGTNDPTAAVRVVIPGPVTSLTLAHVSVGGQLSWIYISDFSFTPVAPADDNAADSLSGGAGNDTLLGQGGNDTLNGGSGDDSAVGGAGADSLTGGAGADRLSGGDGDDRIFFGGGDSVTGDGGDDLFQIDTTDGGADVAATIDGGTDATVGAGFGTENGNAGDILDLTTISSPLTLTFNANAESGTVNGLDADGATDLTFSEIERILLGAGANIVNGSAATSAIIIDTAAGDDQITAGSGNDSLTAGAGNDSVSAGSGNDTVNADDGNDTVDGGAGNDSLSGGNGTDFLSGGDGNDTLFGGAGDDDLIIASGDRAEGGAGDDEFRVDRTLSGTTAITIVGGETGEDATDLTNGSTGDILNLQGLGPVTITYTSAEAGTATYLNALGQSVSISFSEIERVLFDTPAEDVVNGTSGNDNMPTTFVDAQGDQMDGTDGVNDFVLAGAGNDTVNSGAGNDTVRAGTGDDTVFGNTGNDLLIGGEGNDTLDGGDGDDTIVEGGGAATSRSFNWTNNFDGTNPLNGATQTLLGGAPGAVNLTGDVNADREFVFVQANSVAQEAVLAISPNLADSERVQSFTMTAVMDMGSPGGSDHVDGLSFSFGDPNTIGGERENGVSTGLAVRLDPLADVIEVRWNGTVIASVASFNIETRGVGTLTVSVTSGGVVTVTAPLSPSPDITVTIPASSWANTDQTAWQFAFAGRTGSNSGFVYIDDVNISANLATPVTTGGNDSLVGGIGNDTIDGGLGNDTLTGGVGNDSLSGGGGNDSVSGNEGTDTLSGGAGADTLAGGDGDDDIFFGGTDQAFGGGGDDVFALDVADTAADVNATLDGGGDATSGAGFGTENGDSGDVLDLSSTSAALTLIYGTNPESGTVNGLDGDAGTDLTFAEFERILMGIGADTVNGSVATAAIWIDTGAGNDSITTGTGNDSVFGGDGADIIVAGSGNDSLSGGAADDSLTGGAGNDTLDGGSGNDTADYSASAGPVTINLAAGSGSGGDAQGDTLIAIERVVGSGSNDALTGSGAAETLDGGAGNDVLGGAGGDDLLTAGLGNDTLTGGTGNDTLTGGDGADRFVLQNGGGTDRITDFNLTRINGLATDRLDVSALTALNGNPVIWSDVVVTDTVGNGSGDAVLTFPNGQTIILAGVSPSAVSTRGDLWSIGVPCFATGSPIRTPKGWQAVETLRPGDLVMTRDHGPQPVKWTASRFVRHADLADRPTLLPVKLRAGALGNEQELRLSAQHCVLMDLNGEEVLVRVIHLARNGYRGVRSALGTRRIGYHHILLPQHAILDLAGLATESFYPGPQAVAMLAPEKRLELAVMLGTGRKGRSGPRAQTLGDLYGPHARRVLTGKEVAQAIRSGALRAPAAPAVPLITTPKLRLVAAG